MLDRFGRPFSYYMKEHMPGEEFAEEIAPVIPNTNPVSNDDPLIRRANILKDWDNELRIRSLKYNIKKEYD